MLFLIWRAMASNSSERCEFSTQTMLIVIMLSDDRKHGIPKHSGIEVCALHLQSAKYCLTLWDRIECVYEINKFVR